MRDFTNLPFNGYFLLLTRRRDESRAPFFLNILESRMLIEEECGKISEKLKNP